MTEIIKKTPCICTGPGFCERHNVQKNELLFQKCATDMAYFSQGERGAMPQQKKAGVRPKSIPKTPALKAITPEELPCPNRGELIDKKRKCDLCSLKGQDFQVYKCSVHGECSIQRKHSKVKSCVACDDNPIENARRLNLAETTLPIVLKSPRDRRPVWRGGVIQIWVTRACDKACYGCTQGSNLGGKSAMISVDQFATACDSLKDYYGVIGVFGGNPCLHPQFDELCKVMREKIPFEQRGLWSNNLIGHGSTARITFNPAVSNLNVHEDQKALHEIMESWPEAAPYVKGYKSDSRHSPPFVAMKDVVPDEADRWKLIAECDINKYWSAMVCVFRGQLRAYFCEIAGAQAMLHQHETDYPDLGRLVTSRWWDQPMGVFDEQAKFHCHSCGVPLKGFGGLANSVDVKEQVSKTHESIYKLKIPERGLEVVESLGQLEPRLKKVTDYIENGAIR